MSWRSAVEINHDLVGLVTEDARGLFCSQLDLFVKSGDPRHLPHQLSFLYRRHHSEPKPVAIATSRLLRAGNAALTALVEEVEQRKTGGNGEDWRTLDGQVRELRAALLDVEAGETRRRDGTGAAP